MVFTGLGVLLLSWLAALVSTVVTALFLQLLGRSMSWFTHSLLIIPLYVFPIILAMAAVYEYWSQRVRDCK